jgi:hypothetical protein
MDIPFEVQIESNRPHLELATDPGNGTSAETIGKSLGLQPYRRSSKTTSAQAAAAYILV